VLAALSFIIKGGTFFPQSALLGGSPFRRLRSAAAAQAPFTPRQLSVLAHVQAGMTNKAIGRMLGVQESTVKDHLKVIMRKVGARSRTEAALSMAFRFPSGMPRGPLPRRETYILSPQDGVAAPSASSAKTVRGVAGTVAVHVRTRVSRARSS